MIHRSMRRLLGLTLFCLGFAAPPVSAYRVDAGDWVLRPVAGASVNVLRLNVATRETPVAGMITGLDIDYGLQGPWGLSAGLRPVLAPDFIDMGAHLGAKYRWLQLDAPLLPYLGAGLALAAGVPLGYGDVHFNTGLRLAAGADYYVTRHFAVGFEVGTEISWLWTPLAAFELSQEALLGLSWRF